MCKEYRLPSEDIVNTRLFKESLLLCPPKSRREILPIGLDENDEFIYKKLSGLEDILIGGTTSSGKTAFINSLICSILMKHKPSETKLVLIDTRGVEFLNYKDVPHLLVPIIKDRNKASSILSSLLKGAKSRRALFKKNNVVNFEQYNNLVTKIKRKNPNCKEDYLPNIIIFIDDYNQFATPENKKVLEDLLEVNNFTGIHVICATSNPTEECITDEMRYYFYSRVCFELPEKKFVRYILSSRNEYEINGRDTFIFKSPNNNYYKLETIKVEERDIQNIVKAVKENK